MNMPLVMPQAEKPADLINTSEKSDTAKSDNSVVEDNGIFSELLLMLSSPSGNNKAMSQNDGPMPLSSGPNQYGELQNAPQLKCETVPLARHAQTHNEDSGEQKAQLLRFESDSLVRHIQTHNEESREKADISLTAFGDTDSYNGSFDMDSFREDLNKHLENLPEMTVDAMPEIIPNLVPEVTKENSSESVPPHIYTNRPDIVSDLSERLADLYHVAQYQNDGSGEQKAQLLKYESVPLTRHAESHNEESRENRVITDITDDYIHSPGADISLTAFGDTDSYNGSYDMDSFREDFNKHLENLPETTVDAMPEIIPNLVPEVIKEYSSESSSPHIHTNRPDIVSDLSEKLVDLYHIGGRSAKIRLQPEELGNLHIDISVVNDSINAIVTVEENSVKSIIEGNIDMLVEQLRRAGLDIDQFTVNIASSYYDGNIGGGWSDGNSGEMPNDNIFTPQPVYEDTVLSDSDSKLLYAGAAGGISIFA